MSTTQLSQKLGSNNSIFDVREKNHPKSSVFDFSRKHNTTVDFGALVPIDWFDVYPGDVVDLSARYMLDSFPLAVAPMNNFKVRIEYFYIKKSALWAGWNTFITGGRTAVDNLRVPVINTPNDNSFGFAYCYSCSDNSNDFVLKTVAPASKAFNGDVPMVCIGNAPMGLGCYLGIPANPYYLEDTSIPQYYPAGPLSADAVSHDGGNVRSRVSALPFMAYQKIYRYAYLPANLMQDNKVWYPDELDNHWRINYDGANFAQDGGAFIPDGTVPAARGFHFVPQVADTFVSLQCLRYDTFVNDYFTTAKPWIVRGGEETALGTDLSVDLSGLAINGSGNVELTPIASKTLSSDLPYSRVNFSPSSSEVWSSVTQGFTASSGLEYNLLGIPVSNITQKMSLSGTASGTGSLSLTANTLRSLIAVSVWQERNALVSGNYNKLVGQHFGVEPHEPDYEPMYLGGTVDNIQFSRVVQTSSDSGSQVLGSEAGRANANGGASIFKRRFDDYGIVMGIMSIVPEVFYNQGIGHEFTDVTRDDFFTPEFASLGYQEILNREIYAFESESKGADLFGYQTRYAYLKQRKNYISGLFALPSSTDKLFSAWTQAREFTATPELSLQFVTASPDNVRRDFLAFPNYPAFRCQFASDVRLTRALPYQSTPNTFGF